MGRCVGRCQRHVQVPVCSKGVRKRVVCTVCAYVQWWGSLVESTWMTWWPSGSGRPSMLQHMPSLMGACCTRAAWMHTTCAWSTASIGILLTTCLDVHSVSSCDGAPLVEYGHAQEDRRAADIEGCGVVGGGEDHLDGAGGHCQPMQAVQPASVSACMVIVIARLLCT